MLRLLACVALLSGLARAQAPTAAEVRYGLPPDQTPEWTAAGYLPGWSLEWGDRERMEVSWDEPEPGGCRGWLLFGRRLELPADAASITLRFDYRTFCTIDRPDMLRSGMMWAIVVRPEAWDALPADPAAAAVFDLARLDGLLVSSVVHRQGEDVHDWRTVEPLELVLPKPGAGAPGPREVMVGIAWTAAHFGNREGGGLRNMEIDVTTAAEQRWRFWDALDLARPELESVRAAVEARDEAAATAALAEHFRERTSPRVANPIAPAGERELRRADETLARTYRLVGTPPYTFPERIVWNADPHNYNQWAISLNRHFHWLDLAAAWLATRDPRYAQEWAQQVDDWVASMPVIIAPNYVQGPFNVAGRASLSLDAGIRMGQTWFPSFEVLRAAPEVSDATLVTFLRSAWQHAVYLMRDENYKVGSNWGAMESNGLYHLGVLLPEFRDAGRWRDTAMARLRAELDGQMYPDGAQQELAPGYHGVSVNNIVGALALARANEIAVPKDYVTGLERTYDYYLRIAMPDLRMPALNDSGWNGIPGQLARGAELFPARDDFRWGATARAEGSPPDHTSVAMPYAGWVIQRSGWEPDARWLLFDAGPFGTGHQHEDKLSLIVHAYGERLITEAGVYAYDTSEWRKYVLSTRGHSTVRVDGADQNARSDRSEYRATAPDTHGFVTNEAFDYARDTHTAGYGNPPDRSVVHRRRVLFVKPDYWIVVDDLAASDDRDHTATAQFLADSDEATRGEGGRVSVAGRTGAARLDIVPLDSDTPLRIVVGQTEPEVIGFVPDGFENLRPVAAVQRETTFQGGTMLVTAMVPYPGDASPLAGVERRETAEGLEATLAFADGGRHRLLVTPTTLRMDTGAATFAADEPALAVAGDTGTAP